jgi:hypothetical protein
VGISEQAYTCSNVYLIFNAILSYCFVCSATKFAKNHETALVKRHWVVFDATGQSLAHASPPHRANVTQSVTLYDANTNQFDDVMKTTEQTPIYSHLHIRSFQRRLRTPFTLAAGPDRTGPGWTAATLCNAVRVTVLRSRARAAAGGQQQQQQPFRKRSYIQYLRLVCGVDRMAAVRIAGWAYIMEITSLAASTYNRTHHDDANQLTPDRAVTGSPY